MAARTNRPPTDERKPEANAAVLDESDWAAIGSDALAPGSAPQNGDLRYGGKGGDKPLPDDEEEDATISPNEDDSNRRH